MNPKLTTLIILSILLSSCQSNPGYPPSIKEKTGFQTSSPWKPTTDSRADIAIVYGAGDRRGMTFEERVQSWRDRGYTTHFMTGIAWGGYQDYFTGQWDGKTHWDEGQVTKKGDTIGHALARPYLRIIVSHLRYL